MASSELILIVACSGFVAWLGPRFDVLAILVIVILARFRGRMRSMIWAGGYTLFTLVLTNGAGQFNGTDHGQWELATSIISVWLCAFVMSIRRQGGERLPVR